MIAVQVHTKTEAIFIDLYVVFVCLDIACVYVCVFGQKHITAEYGCHPNQSKLAASPQWES